MKYSLVLRKLIISGNIYYQVMDKIIGEETELDFIKVVESKKFLNKKLKPIEYSDSGEIGYYEIDREFYNGIDLTTYKFFKEVNNTISVIEDIQEENDIVYEFYKTFHDFKLMPDYDILEIINNTRENLKRRIIGQDNAINRVLSKIYNNQMLLV